MSGWYIDTCVLGAYYCPEPLSEKSQTFLETVELPAISSLSEVEFFSLIAKKKRIGELTENKARKILMRFQSHLASGYYRQIAPTLDDYHQARELIGQLKTSLHTLDALHLAIASRQKLSLVTSDIVFQKAAKRLRIESKLL
jgi:predicted nucleic acid-binding protein